MKRKIIENGEGKRRGKCDFQLFGWGEKGEERKYGRWSFPPRPTIFFLPNWKENGRGTSIEKKIIRLLSTFLFIPLLYSKSIIIIYYPSFHFSIPYTRHTWWKTQIFSIQEEDTEGMGFQWAHNFVFHPNWKEMRKRRESFVHRPT